MKKTTKALLASALLTAVSGAAMIQNPPAAAAAEAPRKLCDYQLANPRLPDDDCRAGGQMKPTAKPSSPYSSS